MNNKMPNSEEITKAVQEALQNRDVEDLGKKINELSVQVATGFSAVHTRQDITNGKVLKNMNDIEKIKNKENYERLIWLVLTTLVGIVTFFLTKGF